mgnify:CR=1 FL=1
MNPFPQVLFHLGPLGVTDTVVVSLGLSLVLVLGARLAMAFPGPRSWLEVIYEVLERAVMELTTADVRPLVPLVLTLWLFIGAANLVSVLPRVPSPTRDLALTAALALVSFLSGHVYAFRRRGVAYLRQYVQPTPLLLPFNVMGELSRTVALALRLFGNALSAGLIASIVLYLAGLLLPVPLLLLGVLTGVVQAYIFGVLTLVFAASSIQVATKEEGTT